MEEKLVTYLSLTTLLEEIEEGLQDSSGVYPRLVSKVKSLNPFLDPDAPPLTTDSAKKALSEFKSELGLFLESVDLATSAYKDLSAELEWVLDHSEEALPYEEEIEKQGARLYEELDLRQQYAQTFYDLSVLLDQMGLVGKAGPIQQKKLEELALKLKILEEY